MNLLEAEETLLFRIQSWQEASPAARILVQISEEGHIPIYYFGGVCRACWDQQQPRDIDIVVDDLRWDLFQKKIHQLLKEEQAPPPARNRFGGLKFELAGTHVDAWALSDTWAFAQRLPYPESPTILPETTFLNIESVLALIWHPEKPWMFHKGFFPAMESRVLEIQNPENPHPALCLARINKFLQQGWTAGQSVKAFQAFHTTRGITPADIEAAGNKHYG
jgi:hypothetical protein